jgi:hypothetical protein
MEHLKAKPLRIIVYLVWVVVCLLLGPDFLTDLLLILAGIAMPEIALWLKIKEQGEHR